MDETNISKESSSQAVQQLLDEAEAVFNEHPDKALVLTEMAAHRDPKNVAAWTMQALILVALQRFSEVLVCLDSLDTLQLDEPQRATSSFLRARALQELGRHKEAVDAFERVGPNPPPEFPPAAFYLNKAVSLNELGESQKALDAIEQAERFPSEAENRGLLLLQKGIALLAAGQVKSALQVIDDAAKNLTGGIALSYCFLQKGIALNRLGEFAEAAKVLDQAIEKTGQEPAAAAIRILSWFQDSISLARQEQYEQALRALDSALEEFRRVHPPALPPVFESTLLVNRANLLALLGQHKEAALSLDDAEKTNPALKRDVEFWVLKLNSYFNAGRYDEIRVPPPAEVAEHPLVTSMRGSFLLALGLWDEGREYLQRVITPSQAYANDALAWKGIGLAHFNLAQWQEALDALETASKLNPLTSADPLVGFVRASSFVYLGKPKEAWESIKDLPENAIVMMPKAFALQGLGRNEEALQVMNRMPPPSPEAPPRIALLDVFFRGNLLLTLNQYPQSLEAFEKASQFLTGLPQDDPFHYMASIGRAVALARLDRREEALAEAVKATGLNSSWFPRPAIAWELRGTLLAEVGRYEESLQSFNRAQTLEPESADIIIRRGNTLLNLEDYKGSESAFTQALALAKKNEETFEAQLGKGYALNRLELYELAIDSFRQAIAVPPDTFHSDWRIWVGLGEAYRSLGRHQAALRTFQQGWRLDDRSKKSSDLAIGIASVLLDQRQDREALDFLTDARGKVAHDPRIDFNLGVAHYRLKQRDAAKEDWRKASAEGFRQAAAYLEEMDKLGGPGGDWLGYWFGVNASLWRKVAGSVLAAITLAVALLPIIKKDALHRLPWLNTGGDYKVVGVTLATLLLVLLAPTLKGLSFGVGPLKLEGASPEANPKPDVDSLLDKLQSIGTSVTVGQLSAQRGLTVVEPPRSMTTPTAGTGPWSN